MFSSEAKRCHTNVLYRLCSKIQSVPFALPILFERGVSYKFSWDSNVGILERQTFEASCEMSYALTRSKELWTKQRICLLHMLNSRIQGFRSSDPEPYSSPFRGQNPERSKDSNKITSCNRARRSPPMFAEHFPSIWW